MKYIDAEKLKAELEKRLKNVRDYFISEVDYRSVIRQTALHFYELGLNARKEEKK